MYTNKPLPLINQKAPEFKGTSWNGSNFIVKSNDDYIGKWLILFFYPLDFSFICPTEICGLSELYEDFLALNCEILAVSIDSEMNHKMFSDKPKHKGGLFPCNITLLSDPAKRISTTFGVLIDSGIDEGVSQRATFIIDPKGIVKSLDINDINVGRNIQELYDKLKLIQDHSA